jgi:mannitol/fructose-specific phosphotransferase system IIA component (Ntr-type)
MKLSDLVSTKQINLDLKSKTKEGVLKELVGLLRVSAPARKALLQTLQAREELGSTGVGKGIAIPHCRSLVVSTLHVAIGRSARGISFKAVDKKRSLLFFLIVAPPVGTSGDYLIALGTVTQVARLLASDKRTRQVKTARQFMKLMKELEE